MWHKVTAVIKREYTTRVKAKAFIASVFLMPLFMCAMVLLPSFLLKTGQKTTGIRTLVVIDETGEIFEKLSERAAVHPTFQHKGKMIYQFLERNPQADDVTTTALHQEIRANKIYAAVEIPKDVFENGNVDYYARSTLNFEFQGALSRMITDIVVSKRFAESQYSQKEIRRLMRDVKLNTYALTSTNKKGKRKVERSVETGIRLGLGYILVFTLYMFTALYANAVMRSVLEEKTTRITEVIVSSIKPAQLLFGKLIGVCSVCLTLFAIWVIFGVALVSNIKPLLGIFGISVPPALVGQVIATLKASSTAVLAYFFIYFIGGFFLYSTLYAAVGAMCNSDEEAQQLGGSIIMFLVLPLVLMFQLFRIPDAPVTIVLSHIPFFSPILMFMRINVLMPPWWEILLNLGVMVGTLFLVTGISGKIYQVGILMYGKRPTFKELWRWLRY